ncbi:MAG: hypothetical protein EZS28_023147 [Streblomastix strix]|uniref:Uncharacterized protein n=1 Tax=Streblomastix strix TaxID=222440 RepID=A0A5J4VG35_9EUKA|nr:MAG: hypothetical protein EZS28_023147 [Streblomastix strix]
MDRGTPPVIRRADLFIAHGLTQWGPDRSKMILSDAFLHIDPTGTQFASCSARLIPIISLPSLRWPLHPRLFLKGGQRSCEGFRPRQNPPLGGKSTG